MADEVNKELAKMADPSQQARRSELYHAAYNNMWNSYKKNKLSLDDLIAMANQFEGRGTIGAIRGGLREKYFGGDRSGYSSNEPLSRDEFDYVDDESLAKQIIGSLSVGTYMFDQMDKYKGS